ncbi:MAG: hypothetical protein IJ640_00750 [Prevotella sp.]|nr:hypothetical protein [Prevotella sp.]
MRKYLFDNDLHISLRTMPADACKGLLSRSSYHDAEVWATRGELEHIFGDPTKTAKYKGADSHYSWVLDLLSQGERRIIDVYDINHYNRETDEIDFPAIDEHIHWHIGGWGERETWLAKTLIEKRLRDMRSGLIHEIKYVSVPQDDGERLYTPCPFKEETEDGRMRYVCADWCGLDCEHNVYANKKAKVVICKHEKQKQNDMNLDLIGFLESKEFRSDKKIGHLIQLNGRYLTAQEVRIVVRAAVSAGYTDLKSVPDEFAEEALKNSRR